MNDERPPAAWSDETDEPPDTGGGTGDELWEFLDEDPEVVRPHSEAGPWVQATVWVLGAAASGILGNGAYQALQRLVSSVKSRRGQEHSLEAREALIVAKFAVIIRCKQIGQLPPAAKDLRAPHALRDSHGRWRFDISDGQRSFRVTVPLEDLEQAEVIVAWPAEKLLPPTDPFDVSWVD
jgi:hypothetical protein